MLAALGLGALSPPADRNSSPLHSSKGPSSTLPTSLSTPDSLPPSPLSTPHKDQHVVVAADVASDPPEQQHQPPPAAMPPAQVYQHPLEPDPEEHSLQHQVHGYSLKPLSCSRQHSAAHMLPRPPQQNGVEPHHGDSHDFVALNLDIYRFMPMPTVVIDRKLFIRQVSDSFSTVSGCHTRNDLVGNPVQVLFDRPADFISYGSARKAIASAEDTRRPFHMQELLNDGKIAWSVRVVPIIRDDCVVYFVMEFTDTTEEHLRQVEHEQRQTTNETLRILVETVKDYAIFMLDTKGNITTWNAGAQRFKGYKKHEIIGKHFSNFYGDEDRADDKPGRELEIALREGRVEDEGWRYRKDGSKFWANVVITPVYRGDTLIGFGKVTRDLTERRAAEARLVAAYEESAKLKSEFLANMSHEIRTPMHGMLSALTLLLDTELTPEQLDLAKVIQESGGVLLQVINDILDYSKLASGCFSISTDIINVNEIVTSVFRSFQANVTPQTVMETVLDPRIPQATEGDPLRYRQIVQNLVSNATKFTEEGHIYLKATLQKQELNTYTVLTEVIDTGIGVPSDAVDSLFTPFTQIDNSATKRYKGTGLGLSICKSLAELMGGEIGFKPNPDGHGSIFWFTAKLRRVKQSKAKALETLQETLASLEMADKTSPLDELRQIASDKRVLLAEDNIINKRVMIKILNGLGFEKIDTAIDGKVATELVIQDPSPYDLILMDINMPVLDGVGATKAIRAAGITTPIIALTANALKGHAETYLSKGMDFYVAKPVDRKLLIEGLLQCLRNELGETANEE